MNIAMFFIFLISNLIIVPLCRYSYGKMWEYREGMVLGVHIPATCIHHPEVEELCEKYRRNWTLFHRINLAVGTLSCFLCFVDYIVFIIVWSLWLLEYVCGLEYLIIVPHRRMYRLKVKKGWVDERSKKIVRIDTAVSAASEKMALDWKWHLPVLALTAATVFLVVEGERRFHVSWAEAWPIWLLYGTGVGLCLLFLGMHLAVVRRPNRVYSDHTEINLAANRLTKRSWTEGLVYASWLNGASWIWMAFWYFYCGLDLPGTAYGIYTALLILEAAALLFPLARSVRKRQEVLEADTSACYIDDDEYWKWGWYHNPDDRRLFVQNRFSSTNYSLNFGRPGAKVFILTILAAAAAVLIWAFAYMSSLSKTDIQLRSDGRDWQIEAAGYDCEFQTDEILSVDLPEELPDNGLSRSNGLSTPKLQIGHYRDEENAKYMLFVHTDASPVLKIELEDMTIFVNSRDAETTTEWYDRLKKEFNEKEPNE